MAEQEEGADDEERRVISIVLYYNKDLLWVYYTCIFYRAIIYMNMMKQS